MLSSCDSDEAERAFSRQCQAVCKGNDLQVERMCGSIFRRQRTTSLGLRQRVVSWNVGDLAHRHTSFWPTRCAIGQLASSGAVGALLTYTAHLWHLFSSQSQLFRPLRLPALNCIAAAATAQPQDGHRGPETPGPNEGPALRRRGRAKAQAHRAV